MLLTGVPIAFSLGIVAMGFLVWSDGFDALGFVPDISDGSLDSFALLTIPLFVLLGAAIGVARRRARPVRVAGSLARPRAGRPRDREYRRLRIFAAICGSSPATARPSARRACRRCSSRGVPASLATGSICAGGTLGILIPPSITMILYGIATETSIGRLFLAGVLPGSLMLTVAVFRRGLLRRMAGSGSGVVAADLYARRKVRGPAATCCRSSPIIVAVALRDVRRIASPSEVAALSAALSPASGDRHLPYLALRDLWRIFGDADARVDR